MDLGKARNNFVNTKEKNQQATVLQVMSTRLTWVKYAIIECFSLRAALRRNWLAETSRVSFEMGKARGTFVKYMRMYIN